MLDPDFYRAICLLQLTLPQRRLLIWLYEHVGDVGTLAVGEQIGGLAVDNRMMVRVFISKIRRKLKGSGWAITNNTGDRLGYQIALERDA